MRFKSLLGAHPVYRIVRISCSERIRNFAFRIIGVSEVHENGVLVVVGRLLQNKICVVTLYQILSKMFDALLRQLCIRVGVTDNAPVCIDKIIVCI